MSLSPANTPTPKDSALAALAVVAALTASSSLQQ